MLSLKTLFLGTSLAFGAWRFFGSHESPWGIAVARSHIDSDITPHSKGHGDPPKVNLSANIARFSSGN